MMEHFYVKSETFLAKLKLLCLAFYDTTIKIYYGSYVLKLTIVNVSPEIITSSVSDKVLQFIKPLGQKTYLRTSPPSADSEQHAHLLSLIKISSVCFLDSQGLKVSSCGQQIL